MLRNKCKQLLVQERGQAVVAVAVSFAFLAVLVGLAADAGRLYLFKGRLDQVADAASVAGAKALVLSEGDHGYAIDTACAMARINQKDAAGDGDGVSCSPGVVATVEEVTKPDGSVGEGVAVTASRSMDTTFMRLGTFFGCGDVCRQVNIRSRQAAAFAYVEPVCIFALNPTIDHALRLNGTGDLTSPDCGVFVGSNSSDAMYLNGNTQIDVGGPVLVVGAVSASANSAINPTPRIHQYRRDDPLAGLPAPSPEGPCQQQPGGPNKHFTPGHYCSVQLTGNAVATFDPGVYYIDNNFRILGGATATGDGVTFYIDSGSVTISGNGAPDLRAPTSGVYTGVTFFQKRTNTNKATITGSHQLGAGILYFKAAEVEYSGGSCQDNDGMLLVADTILISGSTCIAMPDAVPPDMPLTAALIQ